MRTAGLILLGAILIVGLFCTATKAEEDLDLTALRVLLQDEVEGPTTAVAEDAMAPEVEEMEAEGPESDVESAAYGTTVSYWLTTLSAVALLLPLGL